MQCDDHLRCQVYADYTIFNHQIYQLDHHIIVSVEPTENMNDVPFIGLLCSNVKSIFNQQFCKIN